MVLVLERWQDFVRQVLNHVAHGYVEYAHIIVPQAKAHRVPSVRQKLVQRYPEVEYSALQRHRHKRRGRANVALLQWREQFVVMRTAGQWVKREGEDSFRAIDAREPLVITVGEHIRLRIRRPGPGQHHTAYLDRESYRWLRDQILVALAHRDVQTAERIWAHAQHLPAFRGVFRQMCELHARMKQECRRHRIRKVKFDRPRLYAVYSKRPSGG